ncbi:MAG: hypothetical protein QM756_15160 [Polyangiaceae bacterium]
MRSLASAVVSIAIVACSAPGDDGTTRPRNSSGSGGATQGGTSNAQGGSSGGALGSGGSGTGGAAQGGAAQGGAAQGGAQSGGSSTQGGASQGGTTARGGASTGGTSSGGANSSGGSSSGGSSSGGASRGGASSGGTTSGGAAGTAGTTSSGGGSATCPGFVLCEDFEDGDITMNPSWLATPSSFTVATDGSKVMAQKGSSEAWAYAGMSTWTDVTVQARVKVLAFGGTSSSYCGGIIARWMGSSQPNYQANLCANGTVGLFKDGGLVDETNGTKNLSIVANTWYTLKMKVAGAPGNVTITVSVNDTPAFTITDKDTSAPAAAGYIGVGAKKTLNIEYDDIKVSTP